MDNHIIKVQEYIMIVESLRTVKKLTERIIDEEKIKNGDEIVITKANQFLVDNAKLVLKLIDIMSEGVSMISSLEGFLITPVHKVEIEEVETDGVKQ